jgi:NAD-dependent dihydropyrimidine dehydrogenase PreA subunit
MSIELYYFSGTGNSLRVAKELGKRLPEAELRPVAALWDREGVASKADAVGFVFPVYTMLPPFPIVRLLRKIDLGSARYVFSIVTRAGSAERATRMVERLVAKKGRRLDASWVVTMPGNCEGAFVYGVPTREMAAEQESGMIGKVGRIGEVVAARASLREKDDPPFPLRKLVGPLVAPLILPMLSIIGGLVDRLDINVKYFTDSTCSGCGVCEKVCPSGRIEMREGRPAWREGVRCFLCCACYDYCPSASILAEKSTTDKSRRYRHPSVSADEIAAQKGMA